MTQTLRRLRRLAAPLLLALLGAPALAQQAPAPDAAKQALVAEVLKYQRAWIESIGRNVAEQPALQLLQQARMFLQRVPAEQREGVARAIEVEARKYAESATPVASQRAVELAPQTIGALLAEQFSADELRQLVAMLQSPLNQRFQALAPQMLRGLSEQIGPALRSDLEPRVRELERSVAGHLGLAPAAPAAAVPAASGPGR